MFSTRAMLSASVLPPAHHLPAHLPTHPAHQLPSIGGLDPRPVVECVAGCSFVFHAPQVQLAIYFESHQIQIFIQR
jgi:hypothetical protein